MRKEILGAFLCLLALGSCFYAIKAKAEDKPMVECKDGKCTMSEEDFKRLQEFILATHKAAEYNNKIEAGVNETIAGLRGALDSCHEREKERKAKWGS